MQRKDPSVTELRATKGVTVGIHPDARWREIMEDELSILVKNALAACSIIRDEEVRDVEKAKRFIKAGTFDAAIVMRLVGVDEETPQASG